MILALRKWASRVINSGHDEYLGCWSHLELVRQNNQHIILISVYCISAQQFNATSNTVTIKQTGLLQLQGIQCPKPQNQIIINLIAQIKLWQAAGKEILFRHGYK